MRETCLVGHIPGQQLTHPPRWRAWRRAEREHSGASYMAIYICHENVTKAHVVWVKFLTLRIGKSVYSERKVGYFK